MKSIWTLRMLTLALTLSLGLVTTGCKKPRKQMLTSEQTKAIDENILSEAPSPQLTIQAVLDGRVKLLGADLSAKSVKVGETFEVTWYWEALEDISGDWKVFVHFEAPGRRRTVHDHQPMGEIYPFHKWKKGQIIRDKQVIRVSKDFPNGAARLHVGVFDEKAWTDRQQNVRMKVTNTADVKVPVDGENRILGATLSITGGKAPSKKAKRAADTRPRRMNVYRVSEAPTVDGELGDAVWKNARPSKPFVTPGGQAITPRNLTQVRAVYDDAHLYIAASCRDTDVYNDKMGRDSQLWEQDVLEVYLDPGNDGKDYVELQFSPAKQVFDAHFTSHRTPKWQQASADLTLKKLAVGVNVDGTLNQREDNKPDRRWTLEVAIPWAELPGVDGPPSADEEWAMNFYRIDAKTPTRKGFMAAWAPAGGDFHNTKGFGRLVFKGTLPPARRPSLATKPSVKPQSAKGAKDPEAHVLKLEAKRTATDPKAISPKVDQSGEGPEPTSGP